MAESAFYMCKSYGMYVRNHVSCSINVNCHSIQLIMFLLSLGNPEVKLLDCLHYDYSFRNS